MPFFRRNQRAAGHPEDSAIRQALRELAREALVIEAMLSDRIVLGAEPWLSYKRVVDQASAIAETLPHD